MDDSSAETNPWRAVYDFILTDMLQAFEVIYHDFNVSLEAWLNDVLSHPIAEKWRDEVRRFVDETERNGLEILPESVRVIEALIESRIAGTGQFARFGPAKRTTSRARPIESRDIGTGSTTARGQTVGVDAAAAETLSGGPPQLGSQDHRFILAADKPNASRSYRRAFKDATPAMPDSFEIHHVFEQGREILAERFRKELSVDLNALDNLRGVSEETHRENTAIQTRFWAAKLQEYRLPNSQQGYSELYKRVPLAEVQKLQAEIEATYKPLWVKSGAAAKDVAAVEKRLKDQRLMNLRPARIEGTLKKAGVAATGFAIFTLIAENAALANNIVDPPPHVQASLDNMLKWYAAVYEARVTRGFIKPEEWQALQDATMRYLSAAGFDDKVKALILRQFEIEGARL